MTSSFNVPTIVGKEEKMKSTDPAFREGRLRSTVARERSCAADCCDDSSESYGTSASPTEPDGAEDRGSSTSLEKCRSA